MTESNNRQSQGTWGPEGAGRILGENGGDKGGVMEGTCQLRHGKIVAEKEKKKVFFCVYFM